MALPPLASSTGVTAVQMAVSGFVPIGRPDKISIESTPVNYNDRRFDPVDWTNEGWRDVYASATITEVNFVRIKSWSSGPARSEDRDRGLETRVRMPRFISSR